MCIRDRKDGDKDPDSKKMTRISKQVGSLQKDAQQLFANSLQKSKRPQWLHCDIWVVKEMYLGGVWILRNTWKCRECVWH